MIAWRMLHFSDVQQQPNHEQLFAFADAYLDSAQALCARLCSDEEKVGYAHGAVVMSLAFHSLELFFKGGILRMQPAERFGGKAGHDLDMLSKRYFELYPKREFQFDVPFSSQFPDVIGDMTAEEITAFKAHIEDLNKRAPEDQRHRYPIGINGKTWEGAFGFEPSSFLLTLKELQQVYANARCQFNSHPPP